jgi:hypothetical protein
MYRIAQYSSAHDATDLCFLSRAYGTSYLIGAVDVGMLREEYY